MSKLELRVIAPTQATDKSPYKYKRDVDMVILRCTTGEMGILPGRVPCSMVLDLGLLRVFDGDTESHMAVMGGVAHVSNNIVTVLSDSAQWPEDIDVKKVSEDLKEIERKINETENLLEKDTYRNDSRRCKIQLELTGKSKA
ncbi:MAG: ATP synthase F1 subunit epsilon [Defluviitaleaceae bacterium]|nr:ATP synthase F1 subunit epsilon [Defluviitaleaceae bacterium]